jgi:hypothetical protein
MIRFARIHSGRTKKQHPMRVFDNNGGGGVGQGDSREETVSSVVVLSAFGQGGNIFSVCCSNGEFLLDFLKVIAVNLLASVTSC